MMCKNFQPGRSFASYSKNDILKNSNYATFCCGFSDASPYLGFISLIMYAER